MAHRYLALAAALVAAGCTQPGTDDRPDAGWDGGDGVDMRWCAREGDLNCVGSIEQRCTFPSGSEFPTIVDRDCVALTPPMTCVSGPPVLGCRHCYPGRRDCDGQDVVECSPDGLQWVYVQTCNAGRGEACENGVCVVGCEVADRHASNVGCEYWAVDLDNAAIEPWIEDAAVQQFAVVVSNPSRLVARVRVLANDAPPGEPPVEREVDSMEISPNDLFAFLLPRREVDGSTEDGSDDGSHTAWTANAYKIVSTAPIIAYQFNPFANRPQVFSNDASLLLPKSGLRDRYTVLGWPQTIANTPESPDTNMRRDLRAFLAIAGTEPDTVISVTLSTDVVPLPGAPGGDVEWLAGETFEFALGPYEVLNLETSGFNADFTGTIVEANRPVAVFTGSEASDVPCFPSLSSRRCCADHLEQQIMPDATTGLDYIVARTPSRTAAVVAAGGTASIVDEPEYVRILATRDGTVVRTSLAGPVVSYDSWCQTTPIAGSEPIPLDAGEFITLEVRGDLALHSGLPISVGQFVASQDTTGIPWFLPGGDPAYILVPPVEQWRSSYVFLTPDKYAFDFFIVATLAGTVLELDGRPMPRSCERSTLVDGDRTYEIYRCQLSFPIIRMLTPTSAEVDDGEQNDGVHEIRAVDRRPFGLVVYGFDRYVSYGYPGGLDLRPIPR